MREIYNDRNFIVSYDKDTQNFDVTYQDPLLKINHSITFKNPNQTFQTITFNPNLIPLEEANEIFMRICKQCPNVSFIGLLDGMSLLTLDIEELVHVRNLLTEVIDNSNKIQEE